MSPCQVSIEAERLSGGKGSLRSFMESLDAVKEVGHSLCGKLLEGESEALGAETAKAIRHLQSECFAPKEDTSKESKSDSSSSVLSSDLLSPVAAEEGSGMCDLLQCWELLGEVACAVLYFLALGSYVEDVRAYGMNLQDDSIPASVSSAFQNFDAGLLRLSERGKSVCTRSQDVCGALWRAAKDSLLLDEKTLGPWSEQLSRGHLPALFDSHALQVLLATGSGSSNPAFRIPEIANLPGKPAEARGCEFGLYPLVVMDTKALGGPVLQLLHSVVRTAKAAQQHLLPRLTEEQLLGWRDARKSEEGLLGVFGDVEEEKNMDKLMMTIGCHPIEREDVTVMDCMDQCNEWMEAAHNSCSTSPPIALAWEAQDMSECLPYLEEELNLEDSDGKGLRDWAASAGCFGFIAFIMISKWSYSAQGQMQLRETEARAKELEAVSVVVPLAIVVCFPSNLKLHRTMLSSRSP